MSNENFKLASGISGKFNVLENTGLGIIIGGQILTDNSLTIICELTSGQIYSCDILQTRQFDEDQNINEYQTVFKVDGNLIVNELGNIKIIINDEVIALIPFKVVNIFDITKFASQTLENLNLSAYVPTAEEVETYVKQQLELLDLYANTTLSTKVYNLETDVSRIDTAVNINTQNINDLTTEIEKINIDEINNQIDTFETEIDKINNELQNIASEFEVSTIISSLDDLETIVQTNTNNIATLNQNIIHTNTSVDILAEQINNIKHDTTSCVIADAILTANNETRYVLSANKRLDVNGIKIGDNINNDRFISLSSGGDLFIRNQSPSRNIVLQTYNNNNLIQAQSNIVLQSNKTVSYTNDLPPTSLSNSNTLVTGKYVHQQFGGKIQVNSVPIQTLNIETVTQDEYDNLAPSDNNLYLVEDIVLDGNQERIINVADPISSTDAANKQYVDSQINNILTALSELLNTI